MQSNIFIIQATAVCTLKINKTYCSTGEIENEMHVANVRSHVSYQKVVRFEGNKNNEKTD